MRSLLSATVGVSQLREMVMAGRLLLDSRISTPNIALSSAKTRSQLAKSELPGFLLEKRWVSAPVFAQMGQVSGEVARNLFFQTAQVSKKVARNSDSGQRAVVCRMLRPVRLLAMHLFTAHRPASEASARAAAGGAARGAT